MGATLLLAVCAGCAPDATIRPSIEAGTLQACRNLIDDMDWRIAQADVADGQSARIAGFPYLRVNRLLASEDVKPAPDSPVFDIWVTHLRQLDGEARGFEIANMADGRPGADSVPVRKRIEACADRLRAVDLADESARKRLREAAWTPDDYSVAARMLGLYPFTSVPFKMGVSDLHEVLRADFEIPLGDLPVYGRLTRYIPSSQWPVLTPAQTRVLLETVPRDALGIPHLRDADLALLMQAYAPIFEVDEVRHDDRIGTPIRLEPDVPWVDVSRPTVYSRISHTRFQGEILLQLNYVVWFPARTRTGTLDLLGGDLDGITFRVTLDSNGQPLIYDSMHNCGCYHVFLPGPSLVQRPPAATYEEPPLVIPSAEASKGRVTLRISHGSHYLQRLYFGEMEATGVAYTLENANALRSLPLPDGGRRSLYAPDGLVPGTERGERWLFWPMGVPSPGSMRQWGHHAIAFVGRRHFDDPNLIERYFVMARRLIAPEEIKE